MSREYYLLSYALDRFEEARNSSLKVYVSEVARYFSKGHGRSSSELGRRLHERLWGDPWAILDIEEICVPFPVSWRFRFGWLLGVADLVCFRQAKPFMVVEYKSYSGVSKADLVQVSLYALLLQLNFCIKPLAMVKAGGEVEVDWEKYVYDALAKAGHIMKKRRTRKL